MTTQQIINRLNNENNYVWRNYRKDAKAWEKNNLSRIYIGDTYIEIKNNKATAASSVSRQGYYEKNSQYLDRIASEKKLIMPIDVICRYVNYLIKK